MAKPNSEYDFSPYNFEWRQPLALSNLDSLSVHSLQHPPNFEGRHILAASTWGNFSSTLHVADGTL